MKQTTGFKRVFGYFVTFALIAVFLPMAVSATSIRQPDNTVVAEADLATAFVTANSGAEITLTSDFISYNSSIAVDGKDITLKLGGHKIDGGFEFKITDGGNLTVVGNGELNANNKIFSLDGSNGPSCALTVNDVDMIGGFCISTEMSSDDVVVSISNSTMTALSGNPTILSLSATGSGADLKVDIINTTVFGPIILREADIKLIGNTVINGDGNPAITLTDGTISDIYSGTYHGGLAVPASQTGFLKGGTYKGGWEPSTGGGVLIATGYEQKVIVPGSEYTVVPIASSGGNQQTTYNVTYNANGANGAAPSDSRNYPRNDTVTVLGAGTMTKDGFTFLGWSESATATTAKYKENDTFAITSNTTLYAVWAEDVEITDPETPVTDEPENKLPFDDVDEDDFYYDAIEYNYDKGYFTGISDTEFAGDMPLNRAMFVTVLWRLEGEPEGPITATFNDVEDDTWYTEAIYWAAEHVIVKGYNEDEFGPMDNITREQMAAIMMRYADYKGRDTSASEDVDGLDVYTDKEKIGWWSINNVAWAHANEYMIGREDKTFAPQDTATRAEAAYILYTYDIDEDIDEVAEVEDMVTEDGSEISDVEKADDENTDAENTDAEKDEKN